MIFTWDFIHKISQTFINEQNILVFTMTYFHNDVFIYTLYLRLLLSPPKKYIFGFNQTNSSIATSPDSSFILPATNFFESS